MIHSMTGYGEAERLHEEASFVVEIRSVNNRYFKPVIKLPDVLQSFETEIDKLLRTRLGRGSVNYQLKIKNLGSSAAGQINIEVLRGYLQQLNVLVEEGMLPQLEVGPLLELPGVCVHPEFDASEKGGVWELIQELTRQAMDKLIAMRREEGQALAQDLLSHAGQIRDLGEQALKRNPQVVAEYRDRLKKRVDQLLSDCQLEVGQDELLREVSIFAERCDISEEIVRLKSHLDQFESLCRAAEHTGRKLDFLAQEMLREANTIGSKANDPEIARYVVDMKGLIDRLKEQVQNVE